eukprot:TRINITY_DN57675_c0_g1_i1.p1 TRINITY_DN57675_c0_g1~~TRINITY_DN57675_c0_g1_i1.p1  ORF type:complete len:655 (+),score=37.14 TRINITY_DN57675_c0_g1_i1:79-2043(+)
MSIILGCAFAEFHVETGSEITHTYSPSEDVYIPAADQNLVNRILPDGAHNASEGVSFFTYTFNQEPEPVWGTSVSYRHVSQEYQRGARQVAMALLYTLPLLKCYVPLLSTALRTLCADRSLLIDTVLKTVFDGAQRLLTDVNTTCSCRIANQAVTLQRPSSLQDIDGASLTQLLRVTGKYTMHLWYGVLLRKRIVFVGQPAQLASVCCVSVPFLISPITIDYKILHPMTPLSEMDALFKQPTFVCGATNPLFEKNGQWDILVNLDSGKISVHGISIGRKDKRFLKKIRNDVAEVLHPEEYLRQQFLKYTTAFVAYVRKRSEASRAVSNDPTVSPEKVKPTGCAPMCIALADPPQYQNMDELKVTLPLFRKNTGLQQQRGRELLLQHHQASQQQRSESIKQRLHQHQQMEAKATQRKFQEEQLTEEEEQDRQEGEELPLPMPDSNHLELDMMGTMEMAAEMEATITLAGLEGASTDMERHTHPMTMQATVPTSMSQHIPRQRSPTDSIPNTNNNGAETNNKRHYHHWNLGASRVSPTPTQYSTTPASTTPVPPEDGILLVNPGIHGLSPPPSPDPRPPRPRMEQTSPIYNPGIPSPGIGRNLYIAAPPPTANVSPANGSREHTPIPPLPPQHPYTHIHTPSHQTGHKGNFVHHLA